MQNSQLQAQEQDTAWALGPIKTTPIVGGLEIVAIYFSFSLCTVATHGRGSISCPSPTNHQPWHKQQSGDSAGCIATWNTCDGKMEMLGFH